MQGDEPLIEAELIRCCAATGRHPMQLRPRAVRLRSRAVRESHIVKVVLERTVMLYSAARLSVSARCLPPNHGDSGALPASSHRNLCLSLRISCPTPSLPAPISSSKRSSSCARWHGHRITVDHGFSPHAEVDTAEDLARQGNDRPRLAGGFRSSAGNGIIGLPAGRLRSLSGQPRHRSRAIATKIKI